MSGIKLFISATEIMITIKVNQSYVKFRKSFVYYRNFNKMESTEKRSLAK